MLEFKMKSGIEERGVAPDSARISYVACRSGKSYSVSINPMVKTHCDVFYGENRLAI